MIDKANKLISLVCKMQNNRKTELGDDKITNFDALVLFLYAHGPATAKDIQEFARLWRGQDAPNHLFNSYFSPHGGCTGENFLGDGRLPSEFGHCSGAPKHPPLWYRSRRASRGVTYASSLNHNGMRRVHALLETLRGIGHEF